MSRVVSLPQPGGVQRQGAAPRHPQVALPEQRGLSREAASAYIGVSPSLFDMMVKDGRMPSAKRINARTVWDRQKLDIAFDALPGDDWAANEEEDWSVRA